MAHLKALSYIDGSYNRITHLGTVLENMLHLEHLNLCYNNNSSDPLTIPTMLMDLGPRTRRLMEKQNLKIGKEQRRSLIQRALGVRKNVFMREEEAIVAEQLESSKNALMVDVFP